LRRRPAVAGYFYPADPGALRRAIEEAFTHPLGPGGIPEASPVRRRGSLGFVAPHAGYMYSGPVAAHVYYRLALEGAPETVVIAGPNHTGKGSLVSIYHEGSWETPLGEVEVDSEFARAMRSTNGNQQIKNTIKTNKRVNVIRRCSRMTSKPPAFVYLAILLACVRTAINILI